MKYSILNKQIELNDRLIELHEKYLYAINEVVLRGMIEICSMENKSGKEIEDVLSQMLIENLHIISDKGLETKIQENSEPQFQFGTRNENIKEPDLLHIKMPSGVLFVAQSNIK